MVAALVIAVTACSQTEARTAPTATTVLQAASDKPVSEISETAGHIWLEAPAGNFQKGWATLSETEKGLRVELDLAPAEPVAQPAHIHVGTCDQLGAVVYPLENVIGGHSITDISESDVEDVANGEYSINVHLSFADFKTFTACGEIPAIP